MQGADRIQVTSRRDEEPEEQREREETPGAPPPIDPAEVADGYVLELVKPVRWGKETVRALTFRELTAGDLAHLPASEGAIELKHMLQIIVNATGQHKRVIDSLSVSDMNRAQEVVGAFLTGGLPTGGGGRS